MKLFIALCGLMICAGGCATAVRGDKQKVLFDTDPSGATVQVGDKTATTPVEVPLKRKDDHDVTITKEGYRTVMFHLKANWDGASLPGFLLPGGSVSVAADRASGADLAFYKLPKLKLQPVTDPNTPPLVMYPYRGKLLTKEEYDQTMVEVETDQHSRRPSDY